jgi:hypothetical protein
MATAKPNKTTAAASGRKKATSATAKTVEPKAEMKAAPKKSAGKPSRAKAAASNGVPKAPPNFSEQVRRLAYQFWEERGRPDGSSNEDWYRAEKQLSTSSN